MAHDVPPLAVDLTPATRDAWRLPDDTVLLPLTRGALLVSAGHAVFCGLSPDELAALSHPPDAGPGLAEKLRRHGFMDPPRAAAESVPSVQLQLTNECSLACNYCCTHSGVARPEEAGFETFRAVVDDTADRWGPRTQVGLLGGEPLLVPWALELAEHVLHRGLHLILFTNGLRLVDDAIASRVAALVARGAEVRVSLAGPTAALCDRASGAPRFESVLEGLANLHRFGALAHVDVMLLPQHVDAMPDALPALRRRLPPGTPLALGVLYPAGRESGAHLFRSRDQLERALDTIAFGCGEVIPAAPTDTVAARREGCTCALGRSLHVRSDGTLFTCFKMEEPVGDLRERSFAEAIERTEANARPVETLPTCRGCPLTSLCGGGCRSENLRLTGDPDRPACGPWRVRVLAELLSEDRPAALEWPAPHLLAEAHARGIPAPPALDPVVPSLNLVRR